jgi:predicted ATPase
MIKKIIIQDFFSFKGKNEITLNQGVNILLGINGSGKTSFINVLKLLYEGIMGGFETLFQNQWGGFTQVVNVNDKPSSYIELTYVFDYNYLKQVSAISPFKSDVYYVIRINKSGESDYTLKESLYAESKTRANKDFYYLEFNNGNGKLSERDEESEKINFIKYTDGELSGHELVLCQIKDPMRYLSMHVIRKAIESFSIYGDFDLRAIRKSQSESGSLTKLKPNGENLAHLLNYIKNNKTLSYEKIEKQLPSINPVYIGIEIPYRGGGQLSISLREKGLDRTIEALHISDGTLRYLALMSILCNPERGLCLGIDEPESGLHPDMIKSICGMVKDAENSQIIIATHSPLLLNHFDLEDILVFEKNEYNATEVKRYNDGDFSDGESELLTGQMWLRGQLGGKRW